MSVAWTTSLAFRESIVLDIQLDRFLLVFTLNCFSTRLHCVSHLTSPRVVYRNHTQRSGAQYYRYQQVGEKKRLVGEKVTWYVNVFFHRFNTLNSGLVYCICAVWHDFIFLKKACVKPNNAPLLQRLPLPTSISHNSNLCVAPCL